MGRSVCSLNITSELQDLKDRHCLTGVNVTMAARPQTETNKEDKLKGTYHAKCTF